MRSEPNAFLWEQSFFDGFLKKTCLFRWLSLNVRTDPVVALNQYSKNYFRDELICVEFCRVECKCKDNVLDL